MSYQSMVQIAIVLDSTQVSPFTLLVLLHVQLQLRIYSVYYGKKQTKHTGERFEKSDWLFKDTRKFLF